LFSAAEHDALLRGVRHERAILSTLHLDTPAHRLYTGRGWILLQDNFFFPGVDRRYQIMGLDILAANHNIHNRR
jgi:hypothetical protein